MPTMILVLEGSCLMVLHMSCVDEDNQTLISSHDAAQCPACYLHGCTAWRAQGRRTCVPSAMRRLI